MSIADDVADLLEKYLCAERARDLFQGARLRSSNAPLVHDTADKLQAAVHEAERVLWRAVRNAGGRVTLADTREVFCREALIAGDPKRWVTVLTPIPWIIPTVSREAEVVAS